MSDPRPVHLRDLPDSGSAQIPMSTSLRKCAWCTHTPLAGREDGFFECEKCGGLSDLSATDGTGPRKVEAS